MLTLNIDSLPHITIKIFSQSPFPIILRIWRSSVVELPDTGTHFGFVYQGYSHLSSHDQVEEPYRLLSGMYFCLPGKGTILGEQSSGIVVTRTDYRGMFNLGGSIEKQGRLAYIDGGTSSLLIPPIILGDPCLNAMYLPSQIDQTFHSHPSDRIGIIVAGRGTLETPQTVIPVESGTIFQIPANQHHKFRTTENALTLVVFHPDSDAGFTHQSHPMLQRTMVDGVSAVELPHIQTNIGKKN